MDIGTLTGQIEIEDQFSDLFERVVHRVEEFAEGFNENLGMIAIGAGVVTAAITGMTAAVTALGVKGSDVNDVSDTLEHFAGSADKAEEALSALRAGVKGTVDDFLLAKDASKLLQGRVKLTTQEFSTLGQAAFVLQNRGLGGTKEMLDLVSQALLTGRTRALAMSLGVIDLGDANLNYARTHDIVGRSLSATEKAEAARTQVMQMLSSAVSDAGHQNRDFAEQLQFVVAQVRNFTDELAGTVAKSPAVMHAVDSIGDALGRIFGGKGEGAINAITSAIDMFADSVSKAAPYVADFAVKVEEMAGGAIDGARSIVHAYESIPPVVKILAVEIGEAAIGVYALKTGFELLSGIGMYKWFAILSAQVEIYGVATGVSTTATYAFETAIARVGVAAKGLWAIVIANPWIALAAAIGAATLALTAWYAASQEASLAAEVQGAHQDVINAAITHGADVSIKYADALKYQDEWQRKLHGTAMSLDDALKSLGNNTGNTGEQLKELERSVISAADSGKLSSVQVSEVAKEIKGVGAEALKAYPALSNISKTLKGDLAPAAETTAEWMKTLSKEAREAVEQAIEWNHRWMGFEGPQKALPVINQLADGFDGLKIISVLREPMLRFGGSLEWVAARGAALNDQIAAATKHTKDFYDALAHPLGMPQSIVPMKSGMKVGPLGTLEMDQHGYGLENYKPPPGVMGKIKDTAGDIVHGSFEQIKKGFEHGLRDLVSGGVSSLISGGISLISKGIGGIYNAISHGEARKTNDMRDEIEKANGGWDAFNQKITEAGGNATRFYKAVTQKGLTSEYEKLEKLINLRHDALADLSSTEDKYHFTAISDSEDLLKSYEELVANHHDERDVLTRMSGDFSKLANDALHFNTVLDTKLKDPIQKLIDMGDIVLDDGSKLTDINQLKFGDVGDAGTSAMHDIRDGVLTIVAAIKYNLGDALTDAEKKLLGIDDTVQAINRHLPFNGDSIINQHHPTSPSPPSSPQPPSDPNPEAPTAASTASSSVGAFGGGRAVLEIDGRLVADVMVPHMPDAEIRYGVRR